jgi:hypothetical protein
VAIDDDYLASVLRAPKKFRYNLVYMQTNGLKVYSANLKALMKNQNNAESAI